MSRRKEPLIPEGVVDQLLAGSDASRSRVLFYRGVNNPTPTNLHVKQLQRTTRVYDG